MTNPPTAEPRLVAKRIAFAIAEAKRPQTSVPDGAEVEVWRDVRGIAVAFGYLSAGYAWMDMPGVGTFRFDSAHARVTAYPEPRASSALVHEAYRHAALPIALHYFGAEVLHASAVGTRRGVVAFCAVSETGKSTMAAALGARGFPLWADDAVALEANESPPTRTISLPFDLRLRPASAAYLGSAAVGLMPVSEFEEKPLAALCVLERMEPSAGKVRIQRLPAGQAFAALLPHAYSFSIRDPERKRLMLGRYLRIAAQTPVFRISFAPGFDRLAAVLDAVERTIDAFARGPRLQTRTSRACETAAAG